MKTLTQSEEALLLLQMHYDAYAKIKPFADKHKHPHPTDTRGWSQILVSALTGLEGYGRKKGPDLLDGSDVKAANCWDAIDTPRFNGCIKAGTQASTANSMASLDIMPYLFFVMWDTTESTSLKRCRTWVTRTQYDVEFRAMASRWYQQRIDDQITSNNFQLHPPRNLDRNIFRNNCGILEYPLLFEAVLSKGQFTISKYDETTLNSGQCKKA